jgi:thioredoxin reductase
VDLHEAESRLRYERVFQDDCDNCEEIERCEEQIDQELIFKGDLTGKKRELPVAGVSVYLQGGVPITDFLEGQLQTDESGCVTVDEVMQTSLPGVFAVGDVLCNHLKQAVVAAGEGAVAAMALQRYLSGREQLRPDWS